MSSLTPVRWSRLVQREKERKREKEKKVEKDEVRLFVLAVREFLLQQGIIFVTGCIESEETYSKSLMCVVEACVCEKITKAVSFFCFLQ